MFTPRQPAVEDPWSSDAWADDGWNDAWDDRSRRASIRPAAAPRSAAVDAWLESDQVEFADVTADIARKWVPDPGGGRGVTWDEPEPAVDGRGSQAPQVSDSQPAQPATDVSGAASARHVVEPVTASIPEFVSEPVVKHISDAVSEPVAEQVPEPVVEHLPEPVAEHVPEPVVEHLPEPVSEPVTQPYVAPLRAGPTPEVLLPDFRARVPDEPVSNPVETAVAVADDHVDSVVEPTISPGLESIIDSTTVPVDTLGAAPANDAISWTPRPAIANDNVEEILNQLLSPADTGESPDPIMGSGWDDDADQIDWKDDPVVRALDDDFTPDESVAANSTGIAPELERRSVPRVLHQSPLPEAYDELDRSIDLDLAEELDHELPTYVARRDRKQPPAPAKTKKKVSEQPSARRSSIGAPSSAPVPPLKASTPPVAAQKPKADALPDHAHQDEYWDDIDPNALAASKLDIELADGPSSTTLEADRPRAKTAPEAAALTPKKRADNVADTRLDRDVQPTSPTSPTSAKSLVRLLLTSGLGLGALAVLRLVIAMVATVKASTEITSFGDRLVDAANNLGAEQGVLLILSITLVILGKYASLGKTQTIARLTGRVCGIVLAGASATLLLGMAKLINALGADEASFASSAQALVEFLSFGGMSLVAMYAAWTSAVD